MERVWFGVGRSGEPISDCLTASSKIWITVTPANITPKTKTNTTIFSRIHQPPFPFIPFHFFDYFQLIMFSPKSEKMCKRCNLIITSVSAINEGGISGVDSIDIDVVLVKVAEEGDDCGLSRAGRWAVCRVDVCGIAGEGAAGVLGLVGKLENFLANKVVSPIADAGIEVPIIGGVFWALDTLAVNSDVSILAEAAALIPILIESAKWFDEGIAGLFDVVVDLVVGTSAAGAIEQVKSQIADAGLLGLGVDFIGATGDEDAGVIDFGISWTAPACIELREVGLVDRASLANILDDLQSGLALADAVNEYLIGAAGVDSVAPLGDGIVFVTVGALAADAVDGVVVVLADAVEGVGIEDLVFPAAVAVPVGAGGDMRGRFAVAAIFCVGC